MIDTDDRPEPTILGDITPSQETEALRDSEEQLRLALDAAQLGTYTWDIAANRILWSPQHERLWGFAPGVFDGTYDGFLSRVHPDDAPGITEELARCMATRERFSRDFRVIWPDGSLHWMQGLGEFSVDATGQPWRMRGCVMEITARKRAELELHRFQKIAETIREMVMFIDRDLRYQVVNPAYAALFQATPQALQGCPVSEVVGEALYARIAPELEAALNGETRRFSVRIPGPDGRRRALEATYSPCWDGGRVEGVVVCLHDATETEAARAALEAERTHLEARVAARTAALGASEGMLRTIYDLLTVGISITDRSGRIVDCNQASERLLGITRDEHRQRHYTGPEWSIVRPDGTPMPADAYASVRAMVEQRPVRDVEMGIVKPEGITWLSVSAMPTDHPDYGVVIAYVDISARRRGEKALKASERRWQFALEGAGDGVWDWQIPSGRVFYSHGWKTMLGYGDKEIDNRLDAWEQRVHPEDLPRALADVQAHLDGKTPVYVNEHRLRCKDGSWKWVLDRGKVMERGADGQPLRAIGTHTDISERKQTETRLQASEARARAIIDASPIPFALNDPQQTITYVNPAFIDLFGYTLAEIPTVADWWPLAYPDPDYRQWVMDTWQERLEQARQDSGRFAALPEVTIRCKNGQDRTLLIGASALGLSFDDLLLITFYDITDLKQARETAEQATRVKSEFLANMSHEIRTPLNAMLGLTQLLEGEALTTRQRHLVQRQRVAGQSLLALVNEILDVSKLASGQLRLEARPFAPASVLAQVASLLGQQAHAKGLDFRLDMPQDLAAWLVGDPLRLEQILINLVGNAVKFTEHGEVRIQVSQADIDTQTVRLRLEIHDTGIGIAPENLATLGTAFNQADGSITRRFGGTGLGLAICKQLVERMGGAFGVDSTLGVGSTFWCELPFARASAGERPPVEAVPEAWLGGPRLSGMRCLVVDDSPLNREVVEQALQREGARATLVADGRQALDWLRAQPQAVDAVLMDIQMPVLDGLAATRAIRRELGLTELPVIAFTAGVLAEQRQQAHEAGFSDFLAKPVDLDELVEILARWTNPQPAVAPVAERPVRTPSPTPSAFPDIPGIDRHRAARLLDQDWTFFLRLAHRFVADFADATEQTRQDLARGEVIAATRRLHTLRGLAGNIGALELAQTALTLETALADPRADPAPALATFEARLTALLTALAPRMEGVEPVPDGDPDAPLDAAGLTALREALSEHDLAALDLFEALQPALARRDGQVATRALARMIQSLRFTEARARLAPERPTAQSEPRPS